eukprot:UN00424
MVFKKLHAFGVSHYQINTYSMYQMWSMIRTYFSCFNWIICILGISTSLPSGFVVKESKKVDFFSSNRGQEKAISGISYFIVQDHSTAVVLTAANYSAHLLISYGVIDDLDPMLWTDEEMVVCKDRKFVKIKDGLYK